ELTISSIDPESEKDYVVELLEISPPAALKSLSFGVDFGACGCGLQPCAITTIKKVVELGARSVINLAIEPTFGLGDSEEFLNMAVLEIFDCLPVLPTLDSLTIWLSPNYQAEGLINRLTAPNLTTLIFRIVFNQRNYGHEYVLHSDDFNLMLETVFPWGPYVSGSMKRPLTRKFPLLRQIRFHFCAYRTSDLHSKRGLRRQIERRLKERLKETGADVEEYLELAWLDEDYNLVTYGDCESDNSDEKASDCESGSSEEASDSKSGDSDEEASDCESDNSDEDLDEFSTYLAAEIDKALIRDEIRSHFQRTQIRPTLNPASKSSESSIQPRHPLEDSTYQSQPPRLKSSSRVQLILGPSTSTPAGFLSIATRFSAGARVAGAQNTARTVPGKFDF
ncbi:hypothetical protein C8R44DRAFT_748082, partial [Mycena epipterygia]